MTSMNQRYPGRKRKGVLMARAYDGAMLQEQLLTNGARNRAERRELARQQKRGGGSR